ncbi:hypothetical protein MMC06_002531 [Schaereria dolodes]|nr:hypothetical protein [Schaereria dolodes]
MVSITGLLPTPTSLAQDAASSTLFATFESAIVATVIPTSLLSMTVASARVSSSSVFMAAASAITTAKLSSEKGSEPGEENGECQLFGAFAIFIQGALGALALLSLVFKRWRERPQRPIKIWAFDVSKQVVGSVLLHIANLLMSMLSSGQLSVALSSSGGYQANPCSFYLLNLAIDTTIGIPILIILLRLLTYGFSRTALSNPPESIQSGNYGHPPKSTWWLKQCLIYFIGLLGMKACVFVIFKLCPWIVVVGDWALRWTEGNEALQVFFVMLLFPIIMNALQYYIIDGFIKNQKPSDHEPIPSEDGETEDGDDVDGARQRRSRGQDRDMHEAVSSDNEAAVIKRTNSVKSVDGRSRSSSSKKATKLKVDSKKLNEYNPETDGEEESPTIIGSGSNSNDEEERSLLSKRTKQQSTKN